MAIAGGLVLGAFFTASPLTMVALAAVPLVFRLAVRNLPPSDARLVTAVLGSALLIRLAVIIALFIAGIPHHNDLSVGSLSGDDAYNLSRALRTRDVLMGWATSKYDFVVAFDEYGRSGYLSFLTALQVVFGATPFSVRVLNAVVFLAGATLLFRLALTAFGLVPALAGLAALVFLPSLIYASTSVLKEPMYFLACATLLVASIHVLRFRSVMKAGGALVLVGISLWVLDDLRRGAGVLAPAGIAAGVALRLAAATPRRAVVSAVVVVSSIALLLAQPAIGDRVMAGLESAARIQTGHVFTVGHAYKLLDDGFYVNPSAPAAATFTLTTDQAGRFVARGILTFLATPLPWQALSKSELAVLPEQLIWYLLLLGLPAGIAAGWRRDPLVTAVLLGFVVPTAAVVALTNGNVGTLVRLRGLVTPYIIWISLLGYCTMLEAIGRRSLRLSTRLRTDDKGDPQDAAHRWPGTAVRPSESR